jgi:hypothetical protein
MYISPLEQKHLILVATAHAFASITQKEDTKSIYNENLNKKKEKELKNIISLRAKIIKNLKKVLDHYYFKSGGTIKKLITKRKDRFFTDFVNKLELFNKVRERKGLGSAYVELDYILYVLLSIIKQGNLSKFDKNNIAIAKQLLKSPLSQYKEQAKQDTEDINKFLANVVGNLLETKVEVERLQ